MNTITNTPGVSEAMVMRGLAAWRETSPSSSGIPEVTAILEAALSAPEPAAQAVGEIIRPAKSRNAPVGASVRWFDREPPVGTKLYTAPLAQPAERVPEGWVLVPREALGYVSDLLAERKYGNAARSPAHNARIVVDYWLASPAPSEGGKGVNDTFARELYIASQCDVHNLHTLAWSELTEATRDEWRKKATGEAR